MIFEYRATIYMSNGSPRSWPQVVGEWAPVPDDPDGVMFSILCDSDTRPSPFLDALSGFLKITSPESVVIERGPDLEPVPGLTRENLARFDFRSFPGVGLSPGPASWMNAWLSTDGRNLATVKAGSLTLFLSDSLASQLGLSPPQGQGTEIFIPRFVPSLDTAMGEWLAGLPWIDRERAYPDLVSHVWDFPGLDPRAEDLPEILRAGLGGYEPVPLDWPFVDCVLSALAWPAFIKGAAAEAILKSLVRERYDAVTTIQRQQVELLLLGAIRFRSPNGKRELLLLRGEDSLRVMIVTAGRDSRSEAPPDEIDLIVSLFQTLGAERAYGYGYRDAAAGPERAEVLISRGPEGPQVKRRADPR